MFSQASSDRKVCAENLWCFLYCGAEQEHRMTTTNEPAIFMYMGSQTGDALIDT